MSVLVTETAERDYVPKYLFISADGRRETCKSRHVMKEFLRKRDSIRRQKQIAARAQSRVLPWLRREDLESSTDQNDGYSEEVDGSPTSSSYETSSRATTPPASHWACGSTTDTYESSATSPSILSSSLASQSLTQDSSSVIGKHRDLVDYMNRVLICRLNETSQAENSFSPATLLSNHVLQRPLPAQFLLATTSLSRDTESGPGRPSAGTIALLLEGIQFLQAQIQKPNGVSDDSILAVIYLWVYEATLIMDVSDQRTGGKTRRKPPISPADLKKLQTHIDGLQRSILCQGGLQKLSAETLWSLAWCISTLPGYFPTRTQPKTSSTGGTKSLTLDTGSHMCLSKLFEKLGRIHTLSSSSDFQNSILRESDFLPMRTVMFRLGMMLESHQSQTTPMRKLMRSTSAVSILLFIFDIMLGGLEEHILDPELRRKELLRIQQRFINHRLDQEGSFEKVWQVLMTDEGLTSLQLHPRAWSVAEMVNILKHLDVTTIDSMSKLLLAFLLPGAGDRVEEFKFEKLLLQVHFELDGLASLSSAITER